MRLAPPVAPWRTALSLFTAVPVSGPAEIRRDTAARALAWLPLLGGLLAAAAGGALLAAEASGHSGPRRLLAATIAFAVLAALTGGLHLDGLADTADGLGSRRPRDEALDIMRRSDIGPMGVAALVVILLLQVTALASLTPEVPSAVALVAAVITSRVAVILAGWLGCGAARGVRRADRRPDLGGGQGADRRLLGCAVAAASLAACGWPLAARGLAATAVGLLAGWLVRLVAVRRLGGMTGDVFGTIVEISTTAVLVTCALVS